MRKAYTQPLKVAAHSVLVPGPALEVLLEVLLHVEDLADVPHTKGLALVDREGLRGADRVLDLAAVEVVPGEARVVFLVERHEVDARHGARPLDEDLKDGFLGFRVQVVVPQRDVDARLEGVVECLREC